MNKASESIQATSGDSQSRPPTAVETEERPERIQKPAEVPGGAEGGTGLQSTLETLSLVVGPTTLLTALLFYFGWVHTRALYGFFGIDLSTLDFSTEDYLLRSIVPVLPPLILTVAFALGVMWLYSSLYRIGVGDRVRTLTRASRSTMAAGFLLTLFGLIGVSKVLDTVCIGSLCPWQAPFATPVAIMLGPVTLGYGVRLRRIVADKRTDRNEPRWQARAILILLSLMVALGAFGLFGDWAARRGTERAEGIARAMACYNLGAVVYSKQELPLEGNGVTQTTLQGNNADYRFRYAGLVLFIRSGNKLFLLPERWSPMNGSVTVLPESDSILVEYKPGRC